MAKHWPGEHKSLPVILALRSQPLRPAWAKSKTLSQNWGDGEEKINSKIVIIVLG